MSPDERQMIVDITRMGFRTAVLLRGVMIKKVDRPTLEWGLEEVAPAELMDRYFETLVADSRYVYLMNLLHLVYSLQGQLDFQVSEYGMDSLKDDLQEINFSLSQIGEQFDLPQLSQAV
jgi:hypothetical protein